MAPDPALLALHVTTPRLELQLDVDETAVRELLTVARDGVHDPAEMPFETPWTDTPDEEFDEQFLGFHRSVVATLGTPAWDAEFIVRARDLGGQVIGVQGLSLAKAGPEPETGSWLGQRYQRRGYGYEMRAAVLAFAFDGLGLPAVTSGAFVFNAGSQGVSRKLGYVETHREIKAPRGEPVESIRLRVDRAGWEAHRPAFPIAITGLDAVRAAFPLPVTRPPATGPLR